MANDTWMGATLGLALLVAAIPACGARSDTSLGADAGGGATMGTGGTSSHVVHQGLFACGPDLYCDSATQACELTADEATSSGAYSCRALPTECLQDTTCACVLVHGHPFLAPDCDTDLEGWLEGWCKDSAFGVQTCSVFI
jgi:hypothetical protein